MWGLLQGSWSVGAETWSGVVSNVGRKSARLLSVHSVSGQSRSMSCSVHRASIAGQCWSERHSSVEHSICNKRWIRHHPGPALTYSGSRVRCLRGQDEDFSSQTCRIHQLSLGLFERTPLASWFPRLEDLYLSVPGMSDPMFWTVEQPNPFPVLTFELFPTMMPQHHTRSSICIDVV